MIRLKAIICKLNQLEISDQDIYDHALSSLNPLLHFCPYCSAVAQFIKAGTYDRYMITYEDDLRQDLKVSVQRLECKSCGRTHAILPDILIPFGCHSLRFILTVLDAYLTRSCSIIRFCQDWDIAISTLYRWIHLFTDQYSAWTNILNRIAWVSQSALGTLADASSFPSVFLDIFGFSFLQGLKATPSDTVVPSG